MQAPEAIAHGHVTVEGRETGHAHPGGETAHPHYEGQTLTCPADGWRVMDPEATQLIGSTAVARLIEGERQAERELAPRSDLFGEGEYEELRKWLDRFFASLTDMAVMKAMEYGSGDLLVMAAGMEQMIQVPEQLPHEERQAFLIEAALAFYALGKVGRTFSAFKAGKLPASDNYDDLAVYSAMARRVRELGRWT